MRPTCSSMPKERDGGRGCCGIGLLWHTLWPPLFLESAQIRFVVCILQWMMEITYLFNACDWCISSCLDHATENICRCLRDRPVWLHLFHMTHALVVKIVVPPALRELTGLVLRLETLPCSQTRSETNSSPCTVCIVGCMMMSRISTAVSNRWQIFWRRQPTTCYAMYSQR